MDEIRGDETGGRRKFVKILIIAIVVVLLIIAGWVIYQAVKKTSEDMADIASSSDLEILEAALIENESVQIIVQRNSRRGDLVGINFNISDGQNFTIIRVNTTMQKKDNETFTFNLGELNLVSFVSVSIAPIYLTAEGDETTEVVGATTDTTTAISGGGGGGSSGGGDTSVTPTCSDEIMNGDETGVDCGGSSCSACPTCSDGIMNQDEISVDCGGSCDACFAGTAYYIDESGSDSNNGTIDFPWASLSYACSQVTTPGDGIHVNAGTYIENTQCNLAVGVSIMGEGDTSIIESQITSQYVATIRLHSVSEGTNGDQTISYIKMDGNNLLASRAIQINARSNVSIHDSTFIDFNWSGVTFNGKVELWYADPLDREPTTYATGNKFYNNIINNSAHKIYGSFADGALRIGGQDGMFIYGNEITQNSRGDGLNGYPIKYYNGGYNKGVKIYNNTLTAEPANDIAYGWNFAIELWHSKGGIEIYNNIIYGGIDFSGSGGTERGSYDYAVYVHNNTIGYESLQDMTELSQNSGVYIEREQEGPVIIRYNLFRNLATPIQISPSGTDNVSNIYIEYNIFSGVGTLGGNSGAKVVFWAIPEGEINTTTNNFNFNNNVLYAGSGGAGFGMQLPDDGTATNVTVRNNIIDGFVWYPIRSNLINGSTIDILSIENNIFYNNNINAPIHYGDVPTNDITQNNIFESPDFITPGLDYHLQAGSPAIDAGLDVGLTEDFEGNLIGGAPDIGAYEYN